MEVTIKICLPPKTSLMISGVNPSANARRSVAWKVMLKHLQTIRCQYLPGKNCVLWSGR